MGHSGGPLRFPPKIHCSWSNRFDDPDQRVRTLYCATERLTCFYEVLAPFRPDADALADLSPAERDAGRVPLAWREKHVLCPARIQLFRGFLVDLDDVAVREEIAHRHPQLLRKQKVQFLDRDVILGTNRSLTQMLGKLLYREGAAGLLYPSKLNGRCAALFERRARLVPAGGGEPLTFDIPELRQACEDLRLTL